MTMKAPPPYTNALIHESSPYLLQHAHNPVNWYPWGKEALQNAANEHKLLIVSIGYAACHWCHVMEHESFEDPAVAAVMNEFYVSVKVDREERPDIDQVYMDAAHLMGQQGGWPLNAIALPDGKPVFAGTYFRKSDWINILEHFARLYRELRQELEERGSQLAETLQKTRLPEAAESKSLNREDLDVIFRTWHAQIDYDRGGMQRAPKFPMPVNYLYLLRYHHLSGNDQALKAVTLTLDHMACGGIYDHMGGGFSRYSTDAEWKVPHFEKMLYDNGQLVSLYAEAWQKTKNPLYKEVVYETLAFTDRELSAPEGGFYASLDADSEGEEGRFYIWTAEEILQVLGNEAGAFMQVYHATERGNWEQGMNILFRKPEDLKAKDDIAPEKLRVWKQRMLEARSKRVRPGLDDKVLAGWNALMLKGYVDAFRAFGEIRFLDRALENGRFIRDNMMDGERLNRSFKNGKTSVNAFLDDYALVADAWIALYRVTLDISWLNAARRLIQYVEQHFHDRESPFYYYTSDLDAPLVARSKETSDNVIPASNSVMAKNLFVLGRYFEDEAWIGRSTSMLNGVRSLVEQHPAYHSNWAWLATWMVSEPFEVAILGPGAVEYGRAFMQHCPPDTLLMGGDSEGDLPLLQNKMVKGQTTIYVCRNRTCGKPVTTVEAAVGQLIGN